MTTEQKSSKNNFRCAYKNACRVYANYRNNCPRTPKSCEVFGLYEKIEELEKHPVRIVLDTGLAERI